MTLSDCICCRPPEFFLFRFISDQAGQKLHFAPHLAQPLEFVFPTRRANAPIRMLSGGEAGGRSHPKASVQRAFGIGRRADLDILLLGIGLG